MKNKSRKKRLIFISSTICVFLVLIGMGLFILQDMKNPNNLKEIKLTFTGVDGEGKAILNKSELDKYGLKNLVDKKEFKYEIKPNNHLNNGDKIILNIKNDGIFGNHHKYKYTVKGLKKNDKDSDITKIDNELNNQIDISEVTSDLKKSKKEIETKVIKYLNKDDKNNYQIKVANIFLCKDKNKDTYHIVVNCELNRGSESSYKMIILDDFMKKNKVDVSKIKLNKKNILTKETISDVNDVIRNKYEKIYLI